MTKVRRPLTFQRALGRIADLIGWDGCAEVLGKSESALRKLSDPDIGREISLTDARRLDAAWRRAGGAGAPFLECYSLQLEIADGEAAGPERILAALGKAAHEHGEAVAAALEAARNPSSPAAREAALRELQESIEAMHAVMEPLQAGG